MADDQHSVGRTSSPAQRPATARRVSANNSNSNLEVDSADNDNDNGIANQQTTDHNDVDADADMSNLNPSAGAPPQADTSSSLPATTDAGDDQGGGEAAAPPPAIGAIDSSSIEAAPMDPSRGPDDSVTEEDVREHLKDVESSFLPTLSPIPTGANNADGGVDDTYLFDSHSPDKAAMQHTQTQQTHRVPSAEADSTVVSSTTENLENLDSSPTAAAAARTISRAVSMASHRASSNNNQQQQHRSPQLEDDDEDTAAVYDHKEGEEEGQEDQESSHVSSAGDHEGSQSRSERMDAGSTPGHSLRNSKRPKYLRSRHASQRSSTSSFATNPDSQEGSDLTTLGYGADYALQSGGAVPALGAPSRNSSNTLTRAVSMGSVASGFDDYTDPSIGQLETLPEVDSPDRNHPGDLTRTPKASKENLNTAPTDTVIARHVRNVHVPESLAKEYKFKSGLETPRRPSSMAIPGSAATTTTTATGRTGKNLTLKEQSSTIERLSKENFDLKLKVMFLSDRLDKLSEEGIKEMISENVDLKTSLAVLQRDNKVLRRRIKELERQKKEDDERPSTARSGTSSTDQTARMYDEDAQEREEELLFLRERVEEYATEIERLRSESMTSESEKRRMAEIVRTLGERSGESLGRQEEADVWKDLLEQETARREQADEDNRRLRDEVFRLKQEMTGGPGGVPGHSGQSTMSGHSGMHHTTNIYNISKRQQDRNGMGMSTNRPVSGLSSEMDPGSNFSAASTFVDELRRETEQLRHENAELRREVGAQTSMLTSRNREKERLYQEIEDLKMAARHGRPAPSTADSILDRSASRLGGHTRSQSRGSGRTRQTEDEDAEREREELENKLAELRDKISEVKLQNQELQRELETCMEDFETAVNGKRDAEEQVTSLQEDLENAMNDLVALQSERDEALREQADMENEFEALRTEAQEEIDALEAEADLRNDEMQRLQTDLTDRSENFDALQEEMRKMSDALVGLEDDQEMKLRRIEELEQELDSSNKELEELEGKLLEANEKNQRLSVQQESSQGEIAFLREEQETDKIRIGDLEAVLANLEQSLREERDRTKELDSRLTQEREQREIVAHKEKEDVQQIINQLNKEASTAKDESRRLRKSLSSREVEATEWKERLIELENNLREALGDLNGTRSSLLKSIAKMQRELENTIRELDTTKASEMEKDRLIKQRDALLESHALESRKMSELLEKERVAHRNTKAQYETFQKTHQHLSRTASTQDMRISELENTRNQERRKLIMLEQQSREQLAERNQLLLTLWQKLSALCGREWANSNTLIDRQVLPTLEVVANRLPGFSKNLLAAVKAIETIVASFQTKIKTVERELTREYQSLENNLDVRSKKLDRLETMVRNTVAQGSTSSHELHSRMLRLEDKYRQLKVENATLKAVKDVRARASYAAMGTNPEALIPSSDMGSPSPGIARGPLDRDRDRVTLSNYDGRTGSMLARTNTAHTGTDAPTSGDNETGQSNNDNRWLFRLRDMEYKLKMEREGRNQDRQAARARLGGLENENRDLRERVRRGNGDE